MLADFALAALSAVLWAIVVLSDRVTLTRVTRSPMQLLATSSTLSLVAGLGILLWTGLPSFPAALWALFAGGAFMLSNATFFSALRATDETSEVAVWDCVHPIFVAILATFAGKGLGLPQWGAVCLTVGALVLFQLRPGHRPLGWRYRGLLFLHALFMAVSFLLFAGALDFGWQPGLFALYALGIGTGVIPCLLPRHHRDMHDLLRLLPRFWWLFVGSEAVALFALFCETRAFDRLHPAVATAIASAYPLVVYALEPLAGRQLGLPRRIFPPHKHPAIPLAALSLLIAGLALMAR